MQSENINPVFQGKFENRQSGAVSQTHHSARYHALSSLKTLHLPAATLKQVAAFKPRKGISSFWLASFLFSLVKKPSLDAEEWPLGIGNLDLSETFNFKLLYKVGLPQEWGDYYSLGRKTLLDEHTWGFYVNKVILQGCLQKFTLHFRACVPQNL